MIDGELNIREENLYIGSGHLDEIAKTEVDLD